MRHRPPPARRHPAATTGRGRPAGLPPRRDQRASTQHPASTRRSELRRTTPDHRFNIYMFLSDGGDGAPRLRDVRPRADLQPVRRSGGRSAATLSQGESFAMATSSAPAGRRRPGTRPVLLRTADPTDAPAGRRDRPQSRRARRRPPDSRRRRRLPAPRVPRPRHRLRPGGGATTGSTAPRSPAPIYGSRSTASPPAPTRFSAF